MKKRLISLAMVMLVALAMCFGGAVFAAGRDIENTDWRIMPGGSSTWSGKNAKIYSQIAAVHNVTKWVHVPERTGTYINATYSAVYKGSASTRVSVSYVTFTGAARQLIPFSSGLAPTGSGYMLKTQSASQSQNSYDIEGSWSPDNHD